jgi:hypothetical protein
MRRTWLASIGRLRKAASGRRKRMPKYDYDEKNPKVEKVLAEKVITEREAAKMLGVDRDKVYFRVTYELSTEAPPWALVRIQAIKK